jgi:hypothetical protein
MPTRTLWSSLLGGIAICAAAPSPIPARDWNWIASDRFVVHYDPSTEPLAGRALEIAESTAGTFADSLGWTWTGGRIDIVLRDDGDQSNASTDPEGRLVVVECRKTPIPWRMQGDWLRTAIVHELVHVYTLNPLARYFQASLACSWRSEIRSFGLEVGDPALDVPVWLAEGLAQRACDRVRADRRDPFREMLLADAWRTDGLLDLDEMSRFEGTEREYELACNQGFDFLAWIDRTYPGFRDAHLLSSVRQWDVPKAFELTYGKSLDALFLEWMGSLPGRFGQAPDTLGPTVLSGPDAEMGMEGSARGRWASANWARDAVRFDLWERTEGGWVRREREIGPRLVEVAGAGELWYTKAEHVASVDATRYQLVRRDSRGGERCVAHGSRCQAFDADGRTVAWAQYQAGVTRVQSMPRDSSRSEVLLELPYDTTVESISIAGRDSLLLGLGTVEGPRTALLTREGVRPLWAGKPATWGARRWSGDTLVFLADLGGRAHLCWVVGDGNWHLLRPGVVDATDLDVVRDSTGLRLRALVWDEGSQRIRSLAGAWDTATARTTAAPPPSRSEAAPPVRTTSGRWTGWVASPVRFAAEVYSRTVSDSLQTTETTGSAIEISQDWGTATGTLGFTPSAGVRFGTVDHGSNLYPFAGLESWGKARDIRLRLGIGWYTEAGNISYGHEWDLEEWDVFTAWTGASGRIGLHGTWDLGADGFLRHEYFTSRYQVPYSGATTSSYNTGWVEESGRIHQELGWARFDERSDPAGLGRPGERIWARSEEGMTNPYEVFDGPLHTWNLAAGTSLVRWLGDRNAFEVGLDGFHAEGGHYSRFSTAIGPYGARGVISQAALSLGGPGPFLGYSEDDLLIREMERLQVSLRYAPFLENRAYPGIAGRLGIQVHLEGGRVRTVPTYEPNPAFLETTGFASSCDVSVRQGIPFWDRRSSWFQVGVARPLTHLDDSRRGNSTRTFVQLVL